MNVHTGLIRFLLLNSFFTFQSYSQVVIPDSAASASRAFSIDDCVNEFSPAHVESTKVGYQYWFVSREFIDGRTLKMSVVAPHQATHPPHRHQEDEFFFVLEGKAEFYLDGKTKVAGPYASFYCPPHSEHGIRNVGDAELKYLVIKKYEKKRSGE
jgi:quercetin dioxygenase-like cupin family protein